MVIFIMMLKVQRRKKIRDKQRNRWWKVNEERELGEEEFEDIKIAARQVLGRKTRRAGGGTRKSKKGGRGRSKRIRIVREVEKVGQRERWQRLRKKCI